MEFIELQEQEFEQFALSHPLANFWQSSDMADMRALKGWKKTYVGVKEQGVIVAATMLSHRELFMGKELYQALRGYLIDFTNFTLFDFFHEQLCAYLRAHNAMYLRLDPYVALNQRNADGSLVEGGFDHHYIVDHLKSLGYEHRGYTTGYFDDCEPRWIYVINLENETEESLLANMERKAKRSVLKTEKYNLQVRELDADGIKEFEKVMDHTSERRGFENRENDYYENLMKVFGARNHVKFLIAELHIQDYIDTLLEDEAVEKKTIADCRASLEKQPESAKLKKKKTIAEELLAGIQKKITEAKDMIEEQGATITLASGLFFTYGNEVLCLYSGVYEQYMKFASPYAMHWAMMKWGMQNGKKRYNFYGITGDFNEDAVDYGVFEFKRGYGGEVVELLGDFDYILDKKTYSLYNKLRKVKHILKK